MKIPKWERLERAIEMQVLDEVLYIYDFVGKLLYRRYEYPWKHLVLGTAKL